MNSVIFYKLMSGFYDLLDIVYFRRYESSPRKAVYDRIEHKDRILDLCTGTATNAVNIAKKDKSVRIVGVDISRDMLNIARGKVRKDNLTNVKICKMDATDLKFKDEIFDKVLLSLVLHETEEELAEGIMKEAIRVLKKDGKIIITEWERTTSFIQKLIYLFIELLEPKPYKAFITKDLDRYFSQFGLTVSETVHCDYSKVLVLKKTAPEE